MVSARRIIFFFLLPLLLVVLAGSEAGAADAHVDVLVVDGTVNPVLADYIDRGIDKAENDGAVACIIELDTPGGLLSSTEDIVNRIFEAEVPVVVFVPKGGWAASAGAFITLAADVAAMAPGSVIGASTPIGGGGEELSEDERNKAVNLARQWMKSIAEEHGRNEEAAQAAVTQAASFSPGEARGTSNLSEANQEILGVERLDPPLIDDAGAEDVNQLIQRMGEGITLANGETFTIPQNVAINYVRMTSIEDFLMAISDPNIAYILMSIAMLGILIELSHPGLIFPGVLGGVSLLLSIYSLGILEANYAGLLLILLAFGLFIAEVFTSTFGLLFAGGVISLILGSLILFSGTPFAIDAKVLTAVIIIFTAIFAFVVAAIIRAQRRPVSTSKEGMIGRVAVARTPLTPSGTVFIEGALWNATTEGDRIEAGEEVTITKVDRLMLRVAKKT